MLLTPSITLITQTAMLLTHSLFSIPAVSAMYDNGCYERGLVWDELGTWDDIVDALGNDPIYNTGSLDKGSHPVSNNRKLQCRFLSAYHNHQVRSNIRIGQHCFKFHITVSSGSTTGGSLFVTAMLRHIHDNCVHGGVQKVIQVVKNESVGHFWVRGDPQASSDCS